MKAFFLILLGILFVLALTFALTSCRTTRDFFSSIPFRHLA